MSQFRREDLSVLLIQAMVNQGFCKAEADELHKCAQDDKKLASGACDKVEAQFTKCIDDEKKQEKIMILASTQRHVCRQQEAVFHKCLEKDPSPEKCANEGVALIACRLQYVGQNKLSGPGQSV